MLVFGPTLALNLFYTPITPLIYYSPHLLLLSACSNSLFTFLAGSDLLGFFVSGIILP